MATNFPLSGHRLIEASAGTGKTYTITNLYLRFLLGRGIQASLSSSEVLVLTFTIAATDELRQRIRDRVSLARRIFAGEVEDSSDEFMNYLLDSSEAPDRDRKLLTAALQSMDEASVFTIHGFCARILMEQSFETGTLFDQKLDADRDQLLQMAAEDCFRRLILTLPEFRRNIALSLWRSPELLLNALKPYLFRHGLVIQPPALQIDSEVEALLADIRLVKQTWLELNISEVIRRADFRLNSKTFKRLDEIDLFCQSPSLDINVWEPWSETGLQKASKKATLKPDHQIFELIDSVYRRRTLITQLECNLWHLVFTGVKQNLSGYKQQFGQLTLDDLLTNVHTALNGDGGALLAGQLRTKWPVAMIDEFQDTDDLQYEIFTQVYPNCDPHGLFFIGDPKQAIYQFRGADIYTYINAKRLIDAELFSLTTNWRSSSALVEAINYLFSNKDIFGDDKDIPFEAALVAAPNKDKTFIVAQQPIKPVSIFLIQHGHARKAVFRVQAMEYAAAQTVELLNAAGKGAALINGKPLAAGQIAFLVRERKDAEAARKALANRNIRSVYVTLESVLLTDTASDLKLILHAVIEPSNERALRAALATKLLQTSISEIDSLSHDVITQQRVMKEFQNYHKLWATQEIAPMIEHLIQHRKIAEKWFQQQDGERQITNLRHLAEILQQRSVVSPGMHRLIKWFSREKQAAETVAVEERQLRLESDQHLVQIVTIHAAKGLEYDVVLIPMAGFGDRLPSRREPYLFHQPQSGDQFQTILDIGHHEQNRQRHIDEETNEEMRLLYVAITRTRYKCYIGVPLFRNFRRTALAKLLQLERTPDDDQLLTKLHDLPSDLFEISSAQDVSNLAYQPSEHDVDLTPPAPLPPVKDHWRVHSYSRLARRIQADIEPHSKMAAGPGFDDDDTGSTIIGKSTAAISRFTFPRGPRVGVALHDLMEQTDFGADQKGLHAGAKRCLDKIGLPNEENTWLPVLTKWISDILMTPMSENITFSLANISHRKRLNELEFHFPVKMSHQFIAVAQNAGYLPGSSPLAMGRIDGMMTGFIDLIVRHEDKFYLIDYKSNDLGPGNESYQQSALAQAIRHHQYDLQYLIYTVALNRYLEQRVTNYHYDQHFGGVCYLFLRGMMGIAGSGIFTDLPDENLISTLDDLLK